MKAALSGIFIGLVVVLGTAGGARAEDANSSAGNSTVLPDSAAPGPSSDRAAPTPGQLAAARDLMAAMNAKALVRGVVDAMVPATVAALKQQNPHITDADIAEMTSIMKEEFSSRDDELSEMYARLYAGHFTEGELHQLAAFYRSDVGQKYLAVAPKMIQELMPMALEWGQQIAEHIRERMRHNPERSGGAL